MLGLGLGVNRLAPAPAAFSPASLSGLMAWYDLQDESTVTLVNTNEVDAVADKSGNGYDLGYWPYSYISSSDTYVEEPNAERDFYGDYLNGKKSLSLAQHEATEYGYGGYVNFSFPAISNSAFEMVVVGKSDAVNSISSYGMFTVGQLAHAITIGTSRISSIDIGSSGFKATFYAGSKDVTSLPGAGEFVNSYGVSMPASSNVLGSQLYFNGNLISANITGGSNNSVYIEPGISIFSWNRKYAYSQYPAILGEAMVFSRQLTSDERAALQAYLAAKWGIV
jgi:hypothetical protein